MNLDRIEEVKDEQRALNAVLSKWDTSMDEYHYYSLKDTLTNMLAYVMDNTDVKPKVNQLVEQYKDKK